MVRSILKFLKYILYFILTSDERMRYLMGKERGMHCYRSKRSGLMGDTHEFWYDPNKKPEREYLTWKEFKA